MHHFFIPNLLEFLYDRFVSRPKGYLFERLSREELKKVKSAAKTKTFVERGKLEDILVLLSKLDCGVGLVIWDKENEKTKTVKDVLLANLEVDEKDLTRHLIKSKIFATQSIDLIRALQITSKASHSNGWSVNRKYTQLAVERSNIKQRNLVSAIEAKKSMNWLCEVISVSLNLGPLLEHHKIEVNHFKILLYLQTSPAGATIEILRTHLQNPRAFKYIINKLLKNNMIEYHPESKDAVVIGVHGLVVVDAIISKMP